MRYKTGTRLYVHPGHLGLVAHRNPPKAGPTPLECLGCGAGPFADWPSLTDHLKDCPERDRGED